MSSPPRPQTTATPVARYNIPAGLPPLPYGPPQAQMSLTYQQQQARQAFLNYKSPQVQTMAVNKNGKRPREVQEYDEHGALVPKRLKNAHGKMVQVHHAFGITTKNDAVRPIAADLMEAIHLGDKGFFLGSDAGVKYYIWRSAVRRDIPGKGYFDNQFANIPPFAVPFSQGPSNEVVSLDMKASTYAYFYGCWQTAALGRECLSPNNCPHTNGDCHKRGWVRFFSSLGAANGAKDMGALNRAWGRISAYFVEAQRKWLTSNCDPDDAIAYLRASEEFWWDDTVIPINNDRLRSANPNCGVEVFYPRDIDQGSCTARTHFNRSAGVWLTERQTTSLWLPREKNYATSPRQPPNAFWQRVFTLYEDRKELRDRPPVRRKWVEHTLWQAMREELRDKNTTWQDSSMNDLFDFDAAASDGPSHGLQVEITKSSKSPDNSLRSTLIQDFAASQLHADTRDGMLKEGTRSMQKLERQHRQDSQAATETPTPTLLTNGIISRDFATQKEKVHSNGPGTCKS